MKIKICFFVLCLGLGACPMAPSQAPLDLDEAKADVQAVFEQYIAQLNEQDLSNLERFFSEDARFYWVEDGQIQYPSREALIASLGNFLPTLEGLDLQISRSKIDILDPETALLYAEYQQVTRLQNGTRMDWQGAFSILLRRESGTWRFLIGHSSTRKPRAGS